MTDELVPPEVMEEFDVLRMALDLRVIDRPAWDRLKAIILMATLMASDITKGGAALKVTTARWRQSAAYDGED